MHVLARKYASVCIGPEIAFNYSITRYMIIV